MRHLNKLRLSAITSAILTLIVYFEGTTVIRAAEKIKITIPPEIGLSEANVREHLPAAISWNHRDYDAVEVVIYFFTVGTERISYNDAGDFGATSNDGNIKSLVKLKRNASLIRVIFIDASGSSREEILANFSRALTSSLKVM